jgi:hypothetical protein
MPRSFVLAVLFVVPAAGARATSVLSPVNKFIAARVEACLTERTTLPIFCFS